MRVINQACSSFAADPKRRRRLPPPPPREIRLCLSEAKQKLIQDLWFSRITHSLLALHICFASDEATHQGRMGAAFSFCFSFFSSLLFLSLPLFVFLCSHITTFYRLLVWSSSSGKKYKTKAQQKKPPTRRPKASHHVAAKTQRSLTSPAHPAWFFFFFPIIIPNLSAVSTPATPDHYATLKINRKITVERKASQSKTPLCVKCILQRVRRRRIKPGVKKEGKKETENWI